MQKTVAADAPTVKVIGTGALVNGHSFYAVTSATHPEMVYVVEQWPTRLECLCKDRLYRRRDCKHIRCVLEHKARLQLELAEAQMVEVRRDLAERNAASRATPAEAYRQSSHPGDTALLRRDNRPFAERFGR